MIAALICVVSVGILLQFLVSYCRSILASSGKAELSERVREVAGMGRRSIAAGDFARFLQLIHLCPECKTDQMELRAVGVYYSLLHMFGRITSALAPRVAAWSEQERRNCSHFAAVALDRRISYNRGLFAEQVNGLL
jgi:phosphatidylglycerophosphate synthase